MLFRYGVAVLIGMEPLEEATFLETLGQCVQDEINEPKSEGTEVAVKAHREGRTDSEGYVRS